jgi:hypothetical protein
VRLRATTIVRLEGALAHGRAPTTRGSAAILGLRRGWPRKQRPAVRTDVGWSATEVITEFDAYSAGNEFYGTDCVGQRSNRPVPFGARTTEPGARRTAQSSAHAPGSNGDTPQPIVGPRGPLLGSRIVSLVAAWHARRRSVGSSLCVHRL